MSKEKIKSLISSGVLFSRIKLAYVLVYVSAVIYAATVQGSIASDAGNALVRLLFNGLAVFGVLLVVFDFFTRRVLLKPKYCTLLALFVFVLGISSLLNAKYGVGANLKTMVWTVIQLFLLASIDFDLPKETKIRHFRIVSQWACALWTVCVLLSFWQFLTLYQEIHILSDGEKFIREGFHDNRLFGIFNDPNFASVMSFAVIIFSGINIILAKKKLLAAILHGFVIFFQFIYIVLSGSRTTELAAYLAVAALMFWLTWVLLIKKNFALILKIATSVLCAVLGVALCFGAFAGTKKVCACLPDTFSDLVGQTPSDGSSTLVDFERPDVEGNADISNNRFSIWKDYVKVYATAPIFGTSPRNVLEYTEEHFDDLFVLRKGYLMHNTYLALFVATGALGGVLAPAYLICVALEILGYLFRKRKNPDSSYYQVLLVSAAMIVFAVAMFTLYFLFFNNMMVDIIFWFMLGYVRDIIRTAEPERHEDDSLLYRLTSKAKAAIFERKNEKVN